MEALGSDDVGDFGAELGSGSGRIGFSTEATRRTVWNDGVDSDLERAEGRGTVSSNGDGISLPSARNSSNGGETGTKSKVGANRMSQEERPGFYSEMSSRKSVVSKMTQVVSGFLIDEHLDTRFVRSVRSLRRDFYGLF